MQGRPCRVCNKFGDGRAFIIRNFKCASVEKAASDGSIVDAVINIYPFEVAEMRDIGEFQSIIYAVDC